MIANVHSIETFSSVDGPGVRYVLFLQGCNLACKFCHNIDATLKTENKQMTVDEVIEDYSKYQAFYKNGGITISGGEPLLQKEFILELFKKLKALGVHTAIESSGVVYQDSPIYDEIIKLTDLFIIDLKGVNNLEAMKLAGAKINNTLKLFDKLNSLNKKFCISYVLLPEINDSDEIAEKMANLLSKYDPNNFQFKVLGYHKLGIEKWNKLGLKYELDQVKEATKKEVQIFLTKIRKYTKPKKESLIA
ncbi:MAG: pyruvate formate-lyase-activating protein [Bacilli bacterium]|nr:pyruvate formate-lyase-activating protein [Bacilli bacterium]